MTNRFLRRQKSTLLTRLVGLIVLIGGLQIAHDACANPLGFTYSAYRLNGPASGPLQQGDFVRSGEKLAIKIKYVNRTTESAPAGAIVVSLPSGCALSRSDDANNLEISLDGGRHFDPLSRVQTQRGQDARPVRSSDIIYLRMTFQRPIAPGESGVISLIAMQE